MTCHDPGPAAADAASRRAKLRDEDGEPITAESKAWGPKTVGVNAYPLKDGTSCAYRPQAPHAQQNRTERTEQSEQNKTSTKQRKPRNQRHM